jgi:hypothetical protein
MRAMIPSLRARQRGTGLAPATPPAPLTAPADVAAARLAICTTCEHNSDGNCRMFGCCQKTIARTVTLALGKCPAGRWPRWNANVPFKKP